MRPLLIDSYSAWLTITPSLGRSGELRSSDSVDAPRAVIYGMGGILQPLTLNRPHSPLASCQPMTRDRPWAVSQVSCGIWGSSEVEATVLPLTSVLARKKPPATYSAINSAHSISSFSGLCPCRIGMRLRSGNLLSHGAAAVSATASCGMIVMILPTCCSLPTPA